MSDLAIFGLGSSSGFAESILDKMGVGPASPLREEWHLDGEAWAAALDNVRGRDVFVVSSLYGDETRSVNDKVIQALLFIDALRRASAGRVTLVAPYLAYARQDRKEGSREPVATQAMARMLEAVGCDRLLTMDPHNPGALQNAYRIPIDILEAKKPLVDSIQKEIFDNYYPPNEFVVLSPDSGGVKRAKSFQAALARWLGRPVGFAQAHKNRLSGTKVEVQEIAGEVRGKNVLVVDDVIATGGTLKGIAKAVGVAGGDLYGVVATHGLFVGQAWHNLMAYPRVFVAHTCEPWRLRGKSLAGRIYESPTAAMFAEAIRRIHSDDGSISELLED